MRSDMSKVLVERARRGSWDKYRHYRHLRGLPFEELAEAPPHEGMRIRHHTREKSDHLSPLVGFLRSRCGQPWDKVYSEICEWNRLDCTMQRHVREHVDDYVFRHAIWHAGKVWSESIGGRLGLRGCVEYQDLGTKTSASGYTFHMSRRVQVCPIEKSSWPFYVHPKTGILRENQRVREKRPAKPVTQVKVSNDVELQLLDGVWYRIEYRPFPEQPSEKQRDALTHQPLAWCWEKVDLPRWQWQEIKHADGRVEVKRDKLVRPKRYAYKKVQLSRDELRRHKLSNAAA